MTQRLRRTPKPVVLLLAALALSLAARAALLGQPCHRPCRSASGHVLVFDESYYVNAARLIAGLHLHAGQPYFGSPPGDDPNAEHPQLAKLVIAGSIELLGDGPLAWRLGSLIAGSLAILGMYALVRSAGGGAWQAAGAAALMSADNLLLVHGRIATLDIYVLAAMIWGVALYLRGRPLSAGMLLGIGACFKLVGLYALAVLALYELVRRQGARLAPSARVVLSRLAAVTFSTAGVLVGLLALLDRVAPPYDATSKRLVGDGPFGHLSHMFSYAAQQSSPGGPTGIASYPWDWLVDFKPIVYLNINPAQPAPGLTHLHPQAHFLGMISPPILLLGVPALLYSVWRLARGGLSREQALALSWFLGTFLPFVALSLIWQRTSYLYYMVVVMPGIYIAAAGGGLALARRHRRWFAFWAAAVIGALVAMYPFTPVP